MIFGSKKHKSDQPKYGKREESPAQSEQFQSDERFGQHEQSEQFPQDEQPNQSDQSERFPHDEEYVCYPSSEQYEDCDESNLDDMRVYEQDVQSERFPQDELAQSPRPTLTSRVMNKLPEDKRERLYAWSDRHPVLRVVFATLGTLLAILLLLLIFIRVVVLFDLPDYSNAKNFNYSQPTEVYASDHQTLLARFQLENRDPLDSLASISPYVTLGTIATEDERFYAHGGVDLVSIARAIVNNFSTGQIEGASTITQQLVRNTILADERDDITITRKIREAYLALKMEGMYTKDEILLMYLNTINYGEGAYGIEAASKRYFSKSATQLTLAEAALLVGIPQSPVTNDPARNPENALPRRNVVLQRMYECGAISQEECAQAQAQPIVLNMSNIENDGIMMFPYFTSYVRQQLSYAYDLSTAEVFQGGLKVYTTLDVTAQEAAEIAAADKEEKANKAAGTDAFEVSLVAVDPDTGFVRAMVGGRSYYSDNYNLATQGARQAGSSFKTFTLIAALEQAISPETLVKCNPTVTIGDWTVSNIDGTDYGTRTIQSAFAVSSNTGFARLIAAVGADKVADAASRMGISSVLNVDNSLTLGTADVTPLEMAIAYATIATGGIQHDSVVIEQIVDANDKILVDNTKKTEGTRAISAEVAKAATDVMRTVITDPEGTGTDARLTCGQDAAGKTGTSENYRDSWFVGITPQYSVAIWLGDRTNQTSLTGSITAASAFSDFLDAVLANVPHESFPDASYPTYTKTFSNTDLDVPCTY